MYEVDVNVPKLNLATRYSGKIKIEFGGEQYELIVMDTSYHDIVNQATGADVPLGGYRVEQYFPHLIPPYLHVKRW